MKKIVDFVVRRRVLLSGIIIVGIVIFETFNDRNSREKWFRENLTSLSYKGVIRKKFLDPDKREQSAFILGDGIEYQFYNGAAYDTARAGDSVIKASGTLKHILKRGDEVIMVFYPMSGEDSIMDK